MNTCLSCGYFLNCNCASKETIYCERYKKIHKTVTKLNSDSEDNKKER